MCRWMHKLGRRLMGTSYSNLDFYFWQTLFTEIDKCIRGLQIQDRELRHDCVRLYGGLRTVANCKR